MPATPAIPISENAQIEKATRHRLYTFLERLWPVNGAIDDIAALDGLRGLAVLLTMVDHIFWAETITVPQLLHPSQPLNLLAFSATELWRDVGETGVELFFVLSGFLLFMPYARTILGLQKYPSTGKFYIRRALRILPAYWASLILIIIWLEPQFLVPSYLADVGSHLLLVHDYSQATKMSINGPFWTLAVESHFYLLLPLLAWMLWRLSLQKTGWRWVIVGMLIIAAATPSYGILLSVTKHRWPILSDYLTILDVLAYLCIFVCGMACSWFYVSVSTGRFSLLSPERIRLICRGLGLAGLTGLILYMLALHGNFLGLGRLLSKASTLIREPILGVCFGTIVLGVVLGWRSWQHLFSQPALRFVGIISYSLYIWNDPLYSFIVGPIADNFHSVWAAYLVYIILSIIVIIPFAFIFYHFIERPFIKFKREQH